jgi:hypothetical protein
VGLLKADSTAAVSSQKRDALFQAGTVVVTDQPDD